MRRFVREGVAPVFSGDARREVAGIELGNEVDVSYAGDARRYLHDFAGAAGDAAPYGVVGPSTSEVIAPWQRIETRRAATRFFWRWPAILAAVARAPGEPRCVVASHARLAATHGLGYRLAEINSSADRGVHGVSDVAASATWRSTRCSPRRARARPVSTSTMPRSARSGIRARATRTTPDRLRSRRVGGRSDRGTGVSADGVRLTLVAGEAAVVTL